MTEHMGAFFFTLFKWHFRQTHKRLFSCWQAFDILVTCPELDCTSVGGEVQQRCVGGDDAAQWLKIELIWAHTGYLPRPCHQHVQVPERRRDVMLMIVARPTKSLGSVFVIIQTSCPLQHGCVWQFICEKKGALLKKSLWDCYLYLLLHLQRKTKKKQCRKVRKHRAMLYSTSEQQCSIFTL